MSEFESDSEDELPRELPAALRPVQRFAPATVELAETNDNDERPAEWAAADEKVRLAQFVGGGADRLVPVIALETDVNRVPGQRFVCLSVIKPDQYAALHHGERKYKGLLIKVRGVFATREAADAHIRNNILPLDPHFDVHLIEAHKWSGVEDDDVHDREYMDEGIRGMMQAYFAEENDKQVSMQSRIAAAKSKVKRTKEAGNAWREANGLAEDVPGEDDDAPARRAIMPHERLPALPAGARPVSLEALRAAAKAHNFVADPGLAAEEEAGSDDELMRPPRRAARGATVLSTMVAEE
jgi:hypothetical protein